MKAGDASILDQSEGRRPSIAVFSVNHLSSLSLNCVCNSDVLSLPSSLGPVP